MFKHQETFANALVEQWINENYSHVRTVIRSLKSTAQAAYISAYIAHDLTLRSDEHSFADMGNSFLNFMHPNEGRE